MELWVTRVGGWIGQQGPEQADPGKGGSGCCKKAGQFGEGVDMDRNSEAPCEPTQPGLAPPPEPLTEAIEFLLAIVGIQ